MACTKLPCGFYFQTIATPEVISFSQYSHELQLKRWMFFFSIKGVQLKRLISQVRVILATVVITCVTITDLLTAILFVFLSGTFQHIIIRVMTT